MAKDHLILALKNVKKRGIRSWLTMLGVFIGIAAVVSLISLGQGLEAAITGQFGALSIDTLLIQGADTGFAPPGSASVTKMTNREFEIIESTAGVRIAVPRFLRAGTLEFNNVKGFSFVGSIPEGKKEREEIYDSLNVEIAQGDLLGSTDHGKIVIGSAFIANDLYKKPIKLGSKILVQDRPFKVIGILKQSSTFTLNGAVFMMEEDVKKIFDIPKNEIDFIIAKISTGDQIEEVAEQIEKKLRRHRNQKVEEQDFEVQTPVQSLETVGTVLSVVNIVIVGIALISLLVGGIGITNTMFTSVLERTKEIGIMKAIGAENHDILLIFLFEAGLLGLVGGIIGAALGLGLALSVSALANAALGNVILSVSPSMPLIFSSITFSLIIGVVSGIVPALQASKLNPVDALRK